MTEESSFVWRWEATTSSTLWTVDCRKIGEVIVTSAELRMLRDFLIQITGGPSELTDALDVALAQAGPTPDHPSLPGLTS